MESTDTGTTLEPLPAPNGVVLGDDAGKTGRAEAVPTSVGRTAKSARSLHQRTPSPASASGVNVLSG